MGTGIHDSSGEQLTVESFLSKIGRDCFKFKEKFASWEELFTATSSVMKEKGVAIQQRRYILSWTEKYRCVSKRKRNKQFYSLFILILFLSFLSQNAHYSMDSFSLFRIRRGINPYIMPSTKKERLARKAKK